MMLHLVAGFEKREGGPKEAREPEEEGVKGGKVADDPFRVRESKTL